MKEDTCSPWVVILATLVLCPAAGAVTVTRGPFLQLQTPSSISVVWFTDSTCPGEVEWGLTTGYGHVNQDAVSGTRHEVAITGLPSDTLYHYRVRCGGVSLSGDATFRTAPPAEATAVSFTFVGDSCSAPSNCTATYNAMLPQTANGFCVTLGDLAGRGEDNITDYWQSHFFSPAANFIKHISMYPCIGNHEIYDEDSYPGFVYPTKYLANWSLPEASSGSEIYYSFDKAHVHFISVDTWWSSYAAGSAQYNWLASDLATTAKPWKIVFGHNGPYVSEFGQSDGSSSMRTDLVPLFRQHDVDLYLHGHYHDYQRNVIDGVTYIDQGTGGQSLTQRADDSQPYVQAYAGGIYCYTRLNIQGNRLLGWCRKTADGTILDGYQIDKPPIGLPWQDTFPADGPTLNWTAPWNVDSQCRLKASPGNPSGDGYVYEVADTSGLQYLYPMLASEAMTNTSIEAQIYYDATTTVMTRCGIGIRGRLLFDAAKRSHYALMFVRNDTLASNGHALLVFRAAGAETVLADWPSPDTSGWHRVRLSASGGELSVWIDGVLKTPAPVAHTALPKGRPFIHNYRASGGVKTLVDDVLITEPAGPAIITDFEGYADGTQVMFRQPSFSGSTSPHLAASPNASRVVTTSAYSGSKVCQVDWAFVDTDPRRWLRLTTGGTGNVPNPAVDLTRPIRFRIRLNSAGSLRVCLGIRETGTDVPIGANGGTSGTIEWLGAGSVSSGAPQGVLIAGPVGQWQTLTFDPLADSVQDFTGDGVLSAANDMGTLEHVGLAVVDSVGPFSVDLDLFDQPESQQVTPPTITSHPANRQICPGTNTTFSVAATGEGLSYRWQRDGSDLSDGGHFAGATTATLTVSNADNATLGSYRCRASNGGGNATSNTATLALKAATAIAQQPQSQSIDPGATATLTVGATGAGTIAYQWRKNDVDLVNGGTLSGATTATLQIASFALSDEGHYRCAVMADCGSAISDVATLTSSAPPPVPGDFDGDSDVDLDDFGFFQRCLQGTGLPPAVPECASANLDGDDDVDAADLAAFIHCVSGANRAGDPNCLN